MLMWTAAMVLPFVAHSALPGAPWHSTARLAPWSVTRAESPKNSMVLHRDLSSSEPPATLMEPASDLAESVTQRLRRAFRFGKKRRPLLELRGVRGDGVQTYYVLGNQQGLTPDTSDLMTHRMLLDAHLQSGGERRILVRGCRAKPKPQYKRDVSETIEDFLDL